MERSRRKLRRESRTRRSLGVDPSHEMVEFASAHYGAPVHPNLRFEVADARQLPYREEFDLVVSFNALHWVRQQDEALQSICTAMKPGARAQFRLVCKGISPQPGTCPRADMLSAAVGAVLQGISATLSAPDSGPVLRTRNRQRARGGEVQSEDESWDFKTRSAFEAFGEVTFVEWTRMLPKEEELNFVGDVLDKYRLVAAEKPGEENVFKFYQMNVALRR